LRRWPYLSLFKNSSTLVSYKDQGFSHLGRVHLTLIFTCYKM
jgi:hypothetical protein